MSRNRYGSFPLSPLLFYSNREDHLAFHDSFKNGVRFWLITGLEIISPIQDYSAEVTSNELFEDRIKSMVSERKKEPKGNRRGWRMGNENSSVLLTPGRSIVVALFLLFVWYSVNVLLLFFAGVLLAVFLRSLSDWLSRHVTFSEGCLSSW